jgi:hypothetical protein
MLKFTTVPGCGADFRRLPESLSPLDLGVRVDLSMILLKTTGEIMWGRTAADKETLVSLYNSAAGDVMLLVFSASLRTYVWMLSDADLEKHWLLPTKSAT